MKLTISLFGLALMSSNSLQSMDTSKYINIKQLCNDANFIVKYSAHEKEDPEKIIVLSRWTFPPVEDKSKYAFLCYTKENKQAVVDISSIENEQEMFELIEKHYKKLYSESTSNDTREILEEN